MVWLKFLHITAIAIWSAGLICLPGLYMRRALVPDQNALHQLQALVRFLYTVILSPAAFIAIGSGTILIFVRQTFEPWFSVKLAFVGAMALIHALTGIVIVRLFEKGYVYPPWRFVATTTTTVFVVVMILIVVLAKPYVPDLLPDVFYQPGGLARLMNDLILYLKQ
ncbi:CopD family protein [Tianweitania sp. BSSL-BM11]|uniref:Protoporphyrinogen IX oxidase n=1 Tax=Tianweitania aestuarii TaxID=2814886 RepID=A0ABS5RQT0_9HYPH|nr:CopD family protein [Tianweitania aestuarii]MBS9719317.1 CopD family protein [Tianweitania aestuarii]